MLKIIITCKRLQIVYGNINLLCLSSCTNNSFTKVGPTGKTTYYEGNSISKLQIVIEKNRMEIMTYKQHLFFNIISIHTCPTVSQVPGNLRRKFLFSCCRNHARTALSTAGCSSSILVRPSENFCTQLWTV